MRFGYQARFYMKLVVVGVLAITILVMVGNFFLGRDSHVEEPESSESVADISRRSPPRVVPPAPASPIPSSSPPSTPSPPAPSSPPPNLPPADYVPRPNRIQARHLETVEDLILELTNAERRERGIRPLLPEPGLRSIARAHSDDMIARDFFGHINPDGETIAGRIARGHRQRIRISGENIWRGAGYRTSGSANLQMLAKEIVDDWMNSAGHRENLLRPEFSHLGVGVSSEGGTILATQNFGAMSQ